jgi:hypothetical protein
MNILELFMYWTRWCRWFATSQLLRASHNFGVRVQLKQQGAKSVNGPSFVCSLYSLVHRQHCESHI